jgi:hypothetical protein
VIPAKKSGGFRPPVARGKHPVFGMLGKAYQAVGVEPREQILEGFFSLLIASEVQAERGVII